MSASGARIVLRTTLRDRCRSRAIALMAFPDACSRRILNSVSNPNIPSRRLTHRQASSLNHRDEGSFFDADHPATGVPFPRRSTAQYLIGLSQLAVLALQRLETISHLGRHASTLAAVHLGLFLPTRSGYAPSIHLLGNRNHRCPARLMICLMIQHHPYRTLAHLGCKLVRCLARHGSTFSGVEASDKPGAVQNSADGPTTAQNCL